MHGPRAVQDAVLSSVFVTFWSSRGCDIPHFAAAVTDDLITHRFAAVARSRGSLSMHDSSLGSLSMHDSSLRSTPNDSAKSAIAGFLQASDFGGSSVDDPAR